MSKIIEVSKKGKAAISVPIRKWERVVKAWELNEINQTSPLDKLGFGVKGCGLCSQYNKTTWGSSTNCDNCPIQLDTGERGCDGTPYENYCEATTEYFAKEELDYLRDLDSRCVVVPGLRANRVKA